jgi:hypothetical protein
MDSTKLTVGTIGLPLISHRTVHRVKQVQERPGVQVGCQLLGFGLRDTHTTARCNNVAIAA